MHIILLIILGLCLRLIGVDKPEGLWNDEYVSLMTAAVPFGSGFWEAVVKQCHMPLYYLYLKPFVHCGDLVLRLTSLIPSLLAVSVMYYTGREFSKKTGLFCAAVTAVLPFLVYYAQEVRFYSLVFFLSAVIFYTLVRVIKYGGKRDYAIYSVAALLLILTHHLGVIYLFFTTAYLLYKTKKLTKPIMISVVFSALILVPFGVIILNQLPSSQWWGKFSYTNLIFLFTDFFSPILTNNVNAQPVVLYRHKIAENLIMIIPALVGFAGILFAVKRAKGYCSIIGGVIAVMSVLALSGKVMFITKYLIEILPLMILMMVIGYESKAGRVVLTVFIIFQTVAAALPYYPAKQYRAEGHGIVGAILNRAKPDKVVFTYYAPDRFERYRVDGAESYYISKLNRFEYLNNPERILDSVNSGERVSLVFLDSVSFIPADRMSEAVKMNIPEMFVTFSKIKFGLLEELDKNYGDYGVFRNGNWTVVTAVRK